MAMPSSHTAVWKIRHILNNGKGVIIIRVGDTQLHLTNYSQLIVKIPLPRELLSMMEGVCPETLKYSVRDFFGIRSCRLMHFCATDAPVYSD